MANKIYITISFTALLVGFLLGMALQKDIIERNTIDLDIQEPSCVLYEPSMPYLAIVEGAGEEDCYAGDIKGKPVRYFRVPDTTRIVVYD